MIKKSSILAAAVGVASLSSSALAIEDTIVSFGYTDLNGTYVESAPGTGTFTAVASAVGVIQSAGDVTRLVGPGTGTAEFMPGFVAGADDADFFVQISVFNLNSMLGFADGQGVITITDVDGDIITGDIEGTWFRGGNGQTFFNGDLTNVVLIGQGGNNDATFDGNVGSFLRDLGFPGIFEGAIVSLRLTGGFFTGNFSGVSTQVSGEILPTPGAAALLGLGGLMAARRRR